MPSPVQDRVRGKHLDDLNLSRFVLGTVQFGLRYGIANRDGQPSYEQVRDILACAAQGGVNCLDTAASYGDSEAMLGQALAELGLAEQVVIATKVRGLMAGLSPREAEQCIVASVEESRRRLRQDTLAICLLHGEEFFPYMEFLLKLKDKGRVRFVGVSVMNPQPAAEIIASGLVDVLQIPLSILDQRFLRTGLVADAGRRKVALFARSVYLQGLLLLEENAVPAALREVFPVRRHLARLASEAGLTLCELALRYVLGLETIRAVVVGVDSIAQMRDNLRMVARGPLPPDLVRTVTQAVPDLPDRILVPALWSRVRSAKRASLTSGVKNPSPARIRSA